MDKKMKPVAIASHRPPANILKRWLTAEGRDIGKHRLLLLKETDGTRASLLGELRDLLRSHYVSPDVMARRLADLGAPKTAALLNEHTPITKKARSGDIGEILATEVVESHLAYKVPVRRLRWKDGREMALRGDDIVGLARGEENKLKFLKGESKSRAVLSTSVVDEAIGSLARNGGRPSRHSVLFVAERLREQGNDELAKNLEEAVLHSFRSCTVEHCLFVLTGNNPENFLRPYLEARRTKRRRRHAVGVRINDHGDFIDTLYGGF